MSSDVEKRVVLITGSTSGIGLATARRFTRSGYKVVLNGLETEAEAAPIVDEVKALGSEPPAYFRADLSTADGCRILIEDVIARYGQLDVLINNAGVQKVAPVDEFPTEQWDRLIAVNLDSTFHTIRAALPGMKQRGWGRIVNLSSAHGLRASPYKSAYIAAKHGVVGLTRSVALEVAELGITCNAICPGYVWTPLVAAQVADQARVHSMSEDEVIQKVILAPQPTRKFVQPEEVAELAHYLCGDLAGSITGAALSIDGGWTAK